MARMRFYLIILLPLLKNALNPSKSFIALVVCLRNQLSLLTSQICSTHCRQ